MTSTMSRPWEDPRTSTVSTSTTQSQDQSQRQSLPSLSDLAHGVPASGRAGDSPNSRGVSIMRDSGNWSMQSPSKHSSVMSSGPNAILLPSLGSNHTSPNGHLSVSSDRSPFSTSFPNGLSTNSGDYTSSNLSQLNQAYEPPSQQSRISSDYAAQEAQRNSVDTRMNQLAIASPLPSTNASQTSLVSDLQRERGIPTETPRSNGFTLGGLRPTEKPATTSLGRPRPGAKVAPPINPTPRTQWPNPNAENPTKGFPYAFPDPELAERNSASIEEDRPLTSTRSRRNSIGASSVTSSVFTNDSRMPVGQRRLDDAPNMPTPESGPTTFYNDRNSTDFSSMNHHHHQLQNKQLESMIADPDSPNGQTPYSRTPELRVSHKLAERKRRSEMKGLFEELRSKLPADGRVSKTSKWEILTKAIEYIKALEHSHAQQKINLDLRRREVEQLYHLERENKQLRDEIQRLTAPTPSGPKVNLHYHHTPSQPPTSNTPRPSLPALTGALQAPPPGAMQGVQYSG